MECRVAAYHMAVEEILVAAYHMAVTRVAECHAAAACHMEAVEDGADKLFLPNQ